MSTADSTPDPIKEIQKTLLELRAADQSQHRRASGSAADLQRQVDGLRKKLDLLGKLAVLSAEETIKMKLAFALRRQARELLGE